MREYMFLFDDWPIVLTCVSFVRFRVLVVLAPTHTCTKLMGLLTSMQLEQLQIKVIEEFKHLFLIIACSILTISYEMTIYLKCLVVSLKTD